MKKYLPLIEAVNSICWFWMDFSWMQDWTASAEIGSLLSIMTSILAFSISWTWSSGALMNWVMMNSFWMMDCKPEATICGFLGFIMIAASIVKEGNMKDFIRFKIK